MKLSLVCVSIIVLCGVAHADKKEQADALFKQGKKYMEQKRFSDACESFEKSNKLDPAIGTQLNIAKCYEEWGKIGQAYLAYQAAEKQAAGAKDPREPKIHELVVALYEVAMSADGMSAERHLLVDALTTGEPKVKFPRDLFQTDHFYYFDFRAMQGGYLQAADGDLQTLTLPYQISRADSAVFQVVAQ